MKRLNLLIVATIAIMCGLGALVTDPTLGAAFGLSAEAFPDTQKPADASCEPDECPPGADWIAPVPHGIVSGYRGARPDHQGVDLGSPRGTPVRAASPGVVAQAECQAWLGGGDYSCDRDGSPQVQGCGWHVTITHADDVLTVYCHFVEQPHVSVGQKVDAGDVIGTTGTSGSSSGPHLHLEVHTNHTWEPQSSVDPVAWFNGKGVRL